MIVTISNLELPYCLISTYILTCNTFTTGPNIIILSDHITHCFPNCHMSYKSIAHAKVRTSAIAKSLSTFSNRESTPLLLIIT